MSNPSWHIVVVGGGQSARWLLFAIAERVSSGAATIQGGRITVIESRSEWGTGLAWSRKCSLQEHLHAWATPIPRWSYGDCQQEQFHATVAFLRELGIEVNLRLRCKAIYLEQDQDHYVIRLDDGSDIQTDFVVLATGYGCESYRGAVLDNHLPETGIGIHRSPWPAQAVQDAIFEGMAPISKAQPKHILILGTYLSAIDTAISAALRAGQFSADSEGRLGYKAPDAFKIVIASRLGRLPKVWGREPTIKHNPKWFHQDSLQEALEGEGACRHLPMRLALQLLCQELDAASTEGFSAALSNAAAGIRTSEDVAQSLRRDISTVTTHGKPYGSYSQTRECRWQAVIDDAIKLWSEYSPTFSAEDQVLFDREIRSIFFNYMLPMTIDNAVRLEAMLRCGSLEVVSLGQDYDLAADPNSDRGVLLSFLDQKGDTRVSTYTDVVDATGHQTDIRNCRSSLTQSMLKSGVIQPSLRPFLKPPDYSHDRNIIVHNEQSYLVRGGLFVNPKTREAIPRGFTDDFYSGQTRFGIYAMGPLLNGQFTDAQSLGQAQRDARLISVNICRKLVRSYKI
ncbi:MAG: FAD/NAD(P)-binding protein [Pseudomonadota bacterium]